ncbi:hypothetical protein EKH55_4788 [Sinorhizobium alkalisoli]|nr:hypothetical protein EKH55_4788 [Sinorhizobium alkalisoli]
MYDMNPKEHSEANAAEVIETGTSTFSRPPTPLRCEQLMPSARALSLETSVTTAISPLPDVFD